MVWSTSVIPYSPNFREKGYSRLNFHEMLADSDLNFHKKLMRFEYSRLNFYDNKFSREIRENIVPRNFGLYGNLC